MTKASFEEVLKQLQHAPLNWKNLKRLRLELNRLMTPNPHFSFEHSTLDGVAVSFKNDHTFEDLTIGVPSFNRPYYLRPCIDFMAKQFKGATIVISDASKPEAREQNRRAVADTLKKYPDAKITYNEYPEDIHQIDFLKETVAQVRTEYFLKWDDDDFYNPHGVREAIDYMKVNPGTVSMTGPSVNMTTHEKRTTLSAHMTLPVNNSSAAENLTFVTLGLVMSWYNIFRTQVFRESLNDIMYLRASSIDQLWDLSFSLAIALRGQTQFIKQVFVARRHRGQRVSFNTYTYGRALLYKLIDEEKSADYFLFRREFREAVIRHRVFDKADKAYDQKLTMLVDDVCRRMFLTSAEDDVIQRSVYRDFFLGHYLTNRWVERLQKHDADKSFITAALKIVRDVEVSRA